MSVSVSVRERESARERERVHPLHLTEVPHLYENATPEDPTVGFLGGHDSLRFHTGKIKGVATPL